jgi:hypothetical protein
MTQDGFSIVDSDGSEVGVEPQRSTPTVRRRVVTSAGSPTNDDYSKVTRRAAREAVRSYQGSDSFLCRIRQAHRGDRYWSPNLRTSEALLRIVAAENGGAMR